MDVSDLSSLPEEELRQIRARINFLLKKPLSDKDAGPSSLVHDAIVDELMSRNLSVISSYSLCKKQAYYKAHLEGSKLLDEFVRAHVRPKAKVEMFKIYKFLVKTLCRRLTDEGVPLSNRTVSQGLKRLPAIVDVQFPGYRESGMLPVLFQRILKV